MTGSALAFWGGCGDVIGRFMEKLRLHFLLVMAGVMLLSGGLLFWGIIPWVAFLKGSDALASPVVRSLLAVSASAALAGLVHQFGVAPGLLDRPAGRITSLGRALARRYRVSEAELPEAISFPGWWCFGGGLAGVAIELVLSL